LTIQWYYRISLGLGSLDGFLTHPIGMAHLQSVPIPRPSLLKLKPGTILVQR